MPVPYVLIFIRDKGMCHIKMGRAIHSVATDHLHLARLGHAGQAWQ